MTIALGTDSGSIGVLHGEAVAEELRLFIKAGYSLPEAVRCATYSGAQLLGIENKMGLVSAGRPANFIVARGTPAQLPRKLSYLETIYINGSPCVKKFFQKN
ncbi:MAG: amidohydrolase family protein [Desulfobulbaceae bacterium]|nr:amidohydrolase family protein [Desulfobulbaceae bacterium]